MLIKWGKSIRSSTKMERSDKYGRTYHYPFSPGVKNDDRINESWWEGSKGKIRVDTEKLDGENTCLSEYGLFARSHSAPTTSPWSRHLVPLWERLKPQLGELEIFGENMYAIHSIEYKKLDHHFYVFAVRDRGKVWLSWEEVVFWSGVLDLPVVPVIYTGPTADSAEQHKKDVIALASGRGVFDPYEAEQVMASKARKQGISLAQYMESNDNGKCTMEGIVSRPVGEFSVEDFPIVVSKFVRKDHVGTDEHWTRNWKRAPLLSEKK